VAERQRRAKGEGSIYRLADGRWRGSVDLGWHGGTRRRKQVTRKTKAEVGREVRRLLAAAQAGQLSPDRSPTVEEWMATYLREVAVDRVRPSTLSSYEQFARSYINPWLGRHRLDKLRPQHVTAFYREMGKSLAPSSVRRIHAVLRRALTVAVRWGLITTNPTLLVDPPP
jgi:integrase